MHISPKPLPSSQHSSQQYYRIPISTWSRILKRYAKPARVWVSLTLRVLWGGADPLPLRDATYVRLTGDKSVSLSGSLQKQWCFG